MAMSLVLESSLNIRQRQLPWFAIPHWYQEIQLSIYFIHLYGLEVVQWKNNGKIVFLDIGFLI